MAIYTYMYLLIHIYIHMYVCNMYILCSNMWAVFKTMLLDDSFGGLFFRYQDLKCVEIARPPG